MTVPLIMLILGILLIFVGLRRGSGGLGVAGGALTMLAVIFIFANFPLASRRAFSNSWNGITTFFSNAADRQLTTMNTIWLLASIAGLVGAAALARQKKWLFVLICVGLFAFATIQNFPSFGSGFMDWLTTAFKQPNFSA